MTIASSTSGPFFLREFNILSLPPTEEGYIPAMSVLVGAKESPLKGKTYSMAYEKRYLGRKEFGGVKNKMMSRTILSSTDATP